MAIIIGAILLCGINYIVRQIFGSWFGYSYEFFFIFWAILGGFLGYLTRRVKRQEETLHKLGSTVYDLQQQLKAALQRPAFEVPASTTETATAAALATAAPDVDQKTILIPEEALQPEMQPGIEKTEEIWATLCFDNVKSSDSQRKFYEHCITYKNRVLSIIWED